MILKCKTAVEVSKSMMLKNNVVIRQALCESEYTLENVTKYGGTNGGSVIHMLVLSRFKRQ